MSKIGGGYKKPKIHRFHQAFIDLGINPGPVYREFDLSVEHMEDESTELAMETYFSLLNRMSVACGRRFLTVEMNTVFDTDDFGVLAYILRCADNFNMLVNLLQRYISLVSPSAELKLRESGEYYIISYKHREFSPSDCYQDVEGTLAQIIMMIRELLDDELWLAPQVYFEHKKISVDDGEQYTMAAEVYYNHSYSGLSFPKAIAKYPIPSSDSKLLKILEDNVLKSTDVYLTQQSFEDKVRLTMMSELHRAGLSSVELANELGVSRRTLNRRLQECGTNYNQLREEIIVDLAQQSLVLTDSSVLDIALGLGYSESSAFNRIFKRRTGSTPLQYRKEYS